LGKGLDDFAKARLIEAAVDGNDNIWISNSIGKSTTELCGVRTETCPPGMKTGDAISPPGGFVGGNMDELVDVAIDPAGNVWVTNNWRDIGGVEKGPKPLQRAAAVPA
jgi:hypothetical protein